MRLPLVLSLILLATTVRAYDNNYKQICHANCMHRSCANVSGIDYLCTPLSVNTFVHANSTTGKDDPDAGHAAIRAMAHLSPSFFERARYYFEKS
jgi:hypothetical protein